MARVKRINQIHDLPEAVRLVVLIGPNGSGKTSALHALNLQNFEKEQRSFKLAKQRAVDDSQSLINEADHKRAQAKWRIQADQAREIHLRALQQQAATQSAMMASRARRFNPQAYATPAQPAAEPQPETTTASGSPASGNLVSEVELEAAITEILVPPANFEIYSDSASSAGTAPKFCGRSAHRIARGMPADEAFERNVKKIFTSAEKKAKWAKNQDWEDAATEAIQPAKAIFSRLLPNLRFDVARRDDGLAVQFLQNGGTYGYEGLSAGEKSVIDLIFELMAQTGTFPDAVYWIDEPDVHIHSELQGSLLEEIFRLIPEPSQLWIATQSIGMIRRALDLHKKNPLEVAFIELPASRSGDAIGPSLVNRDFVKRVFRVALHDLADLVVPENVLICEGRPVDRRKGNAEFDAQVYSAIFSLTHPDTDYVSAGNCSDVELDAIRLALALQKLVPNVRIQKVIDRDNLSLAEVEEHRKKGLCVLSRYSIENYLWSDEILRKLVLENDCPSGTEALIIAAKDKLLNRAAGTPDNPTDPLKEIAGSLYAQVAKLKVPALRGVGSTSHEFAKCKLVQLITPETQTFKELEADLFGDS